MIIPHPYFLPVIGLRCGKYTAYVGSDSLLHLPVRLHGLQHLKGIRMSDTVTVWH